MRFCRTLETKGISLFDWKELIKITDKMGDINDDILDDLRSKHKLYILNHLPEDQINDFKAKFIEARVLFIFLTLLTLTYTHLHSLTLTYTHLHSLTLTYTYLHSLTLTYTHLHLLTLTYTHLHSLTFTYTYLYLLIFTYIY